MRKVKVAALSKLRLKKCARDQVRIGIEPPLLTIDPQPAQDIEQAGLFGPKKLGLESFSQFGIEV